MTVYVMTDTHFNHENLVKWGERSASYEAEMCIALAKLTQEDTLIHMGDICIGKDSKVHDMLNSVCKAKRILVRGNHDNKSYHWYTTNGWMFVCEQFECFVANKLVTFSHRPTPKKTWCSYEIHGHTHGNSHRGDEYASFYDSKYHIDICPEIVGNAPLPLLQVIQNKIKNNEQR